MTPFLAAIPAPAPGAMVRALSGYGTARAWREGPLAVAAVGPAVDLPARCVLDGEIDNLAQIANAAGADLALGAEHVLLAARDRLGEQRLLALIRGAFALLMWDVGGRRLLAVRDQIGERGLVWSQSGRRTLVACEVAELIALRATGAHPDQAALAHWLAVMGMPADRTLVDGIRRLLPGHALELTEQRARVWRYWTPARPSGANRTGLDEAVGQVRSALMDSVERRTRAGTAVLLSGGLRSSAVAAFAARATPPIESAYSAVFPRHPTADEAPLIEHTARALGLHSVTVAVREGSVALGSLPYLKRWLLPCATPNLFFWLPLLRRAVHDGNPRLLDGQGGDDCLRPPLRAVARLLYHHGVKGALAAVPARLRQRFDPRRATGPAWLGPELATALRETASVGAWSQAAAPHWWANLVAATVTGPGSTLAFDDIRRRDALVGATSRHPLADVDLLELVLSLPPELAYDPRHSRPLLGAAVDGMVPDRVRLRTAKSNFDAPVYDALAGPDLALARTLLADGEALIGAHIDLSLARESLLDNPPPARHRQHWAPHLWRLLTAELWLRTLADRDFPDRLAERQPGADMCASVVTA